MLVHCSVSIYKTEQNSMPLFTCMKSIGLIMQMCIKFPKLSQYIQLKTKTNHKTHNENH